MEAAASLAVELAIEDRALAVRIRAMLEELPDVHLVDDGEPALIAITDVAPQFEPDHFVILLADDGDAVSLLGVELGSILPKSAGIAELRLALDAAVRGFTIAPSRMFDGTRRREPSFTKWSDADPIELSRRELEVLGLLSEGASNKEIARRLDISVHTAKFHVASILTKFGAAGRTEAVAQAVRLGLLML